jgi:hypothetical protein
MPRVRRFPQNRLKNFRSIKSTAFTPSATAQGCQVFPRPNRLFRRQSKDSGALPAHQQWCLVFTSPKEERRARITFGTYPARWPAASLLRPTGILMRVGIHARCLRAGRQCHDHGRPDPEFLQKRLTLAVKLKASKPSSDDEMGAGRSDVDFAARGFFPSSAHLALKPVNQVSICGNRLSGETCCTTKIGKPKLRGKAPSICPHGPRPPAE